MIHEMELPRNTTKSNRDNELHMRPSFHEDLQLNMQAETNMLKAISSQDKIWNKKYFVLKRLTRTMAYIIQQ
jgi:hypothetical protein